MRIYQQRKQRRNCILLRIRVQRVCSHQLFKLWPLMVSSSIKIGTRGSKLALWQAEWVRSTLIDKYPSLSIDLVVIKTKGDKILDVPLAKIGGKGLFIKEIEEAILDGRIDLAVHSMKDMPAAVPPGLTMGAIPKREIPDDVLISRHGQRFSELNHGARIGTSSLRRAAQIRHARSDITILPLRGNLDTRLKKLDSDNEKLDAIVVAAAGIKRLNLENRIAEYLDETIMLPAVGQGALCIECRENDPKMVSILAKLDDPETRTVVMAERAFLNRLGGSCQVPIAGFGKIEKDTFSLNGLVADLDGKTLCRDSHSGPVNLSENIGVELAERLMAMGADKILEELKSNAQ
jgi:hydroxymethylbilane synthase